MDSKRKEFAPKGGLGGWGGGGAGASSFRVDSLKGKNLLPRGVDSF